MAEKTRSELLRLRLSSRDGTVAVELLIKSYKRAPAQEIFSTAPPVI